MGSKEKTIINLASREANLKRKLRRHLRTLGFQKSESGLFQIEGNSKEVIRTLHAAQREERLRANRQFISDKAHVAAQALRQRHRHRS